MSRICLSLFAIVILATTALAVDPPEDLGYAVLGIYTAETAESGDVYLDDVVAGNTYTIHFVLYHHRLESHNLGGFEYSWRVDPVEATPLVLEYNWLYEYPYFYNFGSTFDLMVGLAWRDPHAPDEPWYLGSADIMFTETPNNATIYLGPSSLETIPGEMAYADLVLPDQVHVMKPNSPSQSMDDAVFYINSVVAVEADSWSNVKALFE